MAKIFVSHAHEDKVAARQIAHALAEAGLEPWLDEREMRSGNELLRTISTVLIEADYFVIVLSRTALTKPWVLTEMRMALTAEIEKGRPTVIVLRLNDCELPIELLHKLYLDLRGRFEEGLKDLSGHMGGVARATSVPKQTVLAQMITNADAELWRRLSAGSGARDELTKTEAANVIRDLRSGEMEAAVAIGHQWTGHVFKWWEDSLLPVIRRAADASEIGARRILKRLVDAGFLVQADDLDYRNQSENAWCDGSMLWSA